MSDLERCHLGDVCGEPLPTRLEPLIWPVQRPHWVQRGVHLILAWTAGLIVSALVVMWLTVMLFFSPLRAMEVPTDPYERRVFFDCYVDAVRLCSRTFASGRNAILQCMLDHKNSLRPKCSRHLFDNERKDNAPL